MEKCRDGPLRESELSIENDTNKSALTSPQLETFEAHMEVLEGIAQSLHTNSGWNARFAREIALERREERFEDMATRFNQLQDELENTRRLKQRAEEEMLSRAELANKIEEQATRTVLAADKRVKDLEGELRIAYDENKALARILIQHRKDVSRLELVLRQHREENDRIKLSLAKELETERKSRQVLEQNFRQLELRVGTADDCEVLRKNIRKLKSKLEGMSEKLEEGRKEIESKEKLQEEIQKLRAVVRNISKQKPLFDKVSGMLLRTSRMLEEE